MSEPTSIAAAPVAGGIVLAGVATGLQAELVLPAFVGALWSLKTLEASSAGVAWRVVQVVVGTLAATWSAPLASQFAAGMVPDALGVTPDMLRYPVALAVGWGGLHLILPRLARAVDGGST